MKKLIAILLFVAGVTAAAQAQTKAADVAKFTSETVSLGKIKQGNPTTATFTVTNISKMPLIIEKAMPSCGCTASDYTKTPIAPGKTGFIKATYNAAAPGNFTKTVSVKFAGSDDVVPLTISGEVMPGADAAAATPGNAH